VTVLKKLEFRALLHQAEQAMSKQEIAAVETVPEEKLEPAKKVAFDPKDYPADKPRVAATDPEAIELWISSKPGEYSIVNLKESDGLLAAPLIGHDLKSLFRACLAVESGCGGNVLHDTRIGAFLINSLERSRELT